MSPVPPTSASDMIKVDRKTLSELTPLKRLIYLLDVSLKTLNCEVKPLQLEAWSVLVHESMSGRGRTFHTVDHVFDISDGAEALQILAALFHDVVYYQVDGGVPPRLEEHLLDAIVIEGEMVKLAPFNAEDDPTREMVLAIFGMKHEQVLSPFAGLNEFLSALLAARAFDQILPPDTLARLITCIEATLPFRSPSIDGDGPSEGLFRRLTLVNERFALGMTPELIEHTIHLAVGLANRDVGNFEYEDTARFLDNTWKLLPETNTPLRIGSVYTISEYRFAIQKMEGFIGFLKPPFVFRQFRGQPDDQSFSRMLDRAQQNLTVSVGYLGAKLLAAMVLEALAALTGGDAPISYFMGDLPIPGEICLCIRLEDLLPDPKNDTANRATDIHRDILRILTKGRTSEIGFDIRHSPLAAFIYRNFGDKNLSATLKVFKTAKKTDENHRGLLKTLPQEVLSTIMLACEKTAITRKDGLRALSASLYNT